MLFLFLQFNSHQTRADEFLSIRSVWVWSDSRIGREYSKKSEECFAVLLFYAFIPSVLTEVTNTLHFRIIEQCNQLVIFRYVQVLVRRLWSIPCTFSIRARALGRGLAFPVHSHKAEPNNLNWHLKLASDPLVVGASFNGITVKTAASLFCKCAPYQ
jgi:hypothetical protein